MFIYKQAQDSKNIKKVFVMFVNDDEQKAKLVIFKYGYPEIYVRMLVKIIDKFR
jgi:hypothetical protein